MKLKKRIFLIIILLFFDITIIQATGFEFKQKRHRESKYDRYLPGGLSQINVSVGGFNYALSAENFYEYESGIKYPHSHPFIKEILKSQGFAFNMNILGKLEKSAPQENSWVKPTWKYTKTINSSRFQATLKAREFELKFILTYWGLIGLDFGFINLSNAFIDRLRVPKYFFIAPIRKPTLPTNYFIEPKSLFMT